MMNDIQLLIQFLKIFTLIFVIVFFIWHSNSNVNKLY